MSSVATDKKNTDCIMRAGISQKLISALFCYGDDENGHRACTSGHLMTANQSEIRKEYLVSACGQ